jgi:hypothetical protein
LYGNAAQVYATSGKSSGNEGEESMLHEIHHESPSREGSYLMWHLAGAVDKEVMIECVLGLSHPLWVYNTIYARYSCVFGRFCARVFCYWDGSLLLA